MTSAPANKHQLTNAFPKVSRGAPAMCVTFGGGLIESNKKQGFLCSGAYIMELPAGGITN